MQFIGRLAESEQVPVSRTISRFAYGHRRVGKSELLRQAVRGSGLPYVFFKCHQTSESQNLTTFRFGFIARCGYDGVKSTENHSLHTLADLYDPENFD